MSLLVRHPQAHDEGPSAYRFRLATDNMLSVRQLCEVDNIAGSEAEGTPQGPKSASSVDPGLGPWLRRWSRFCPACVGAARPWSIGWEIFFADACGACGGWLVDTCSSCGERVTWNRKGLLRCDCGQCLAAEKSHAAPIAVVQLSRALASLAKGGSAEDVPILTGLSIDQCVRVVRLLGTYGSHDGAGPPQKVSNVDRVDVSWPFSSIAAEILCTWPAGMGELLRRLNDRVDDEGRGRLGKAFGGLYAAIYKSFAAPEFDFLRRAFEGYIAEHWTGPLARRNRRLDGSVLAAAAWIPANHACRLLGMSRRRLLSLIDEGRVRSERRRSPAEREFVVVAKEDVEQLAGDMDGEVTLVAAAERLGLKRQRLSALLPVICPQARKLGERGCPWSVPKKWVTDWEDVVQEFDAVPRYSGTNAVTLAHVLSYWPWTDEQIGQLINDIAARRVTPVGLSSEVRGIGALLLDSDLIRAQFAARQCRNASEFAIPQVAVRLEVKQEVAYSLVRSGLLQTVDRRVGRRAERRVTASALQGFQDRYVFCRDLARSLARSPKAVALFLMGDGVRPAAGADVDGCRQLVFVRAEVSDCLDRHGIKVKLVTDNRAIEAGGGNEFKGGTKCLDMTG